MKNIKKPGVKTPTEPMYYELGYQDICELWFARLIYEQLDYLFESENSCTCHATYSDNHFSVDQYSTDITSNPQSVDLGAFDRAISHNMQGSEALIDLIACKLIAVDESYRQLDREVIVRIITHWAFYPVYDVYATADKLAELYYNAHTNPVQLGAIPITRGTICAAALTIKDRDRKQIEIPYSASVLGKVRVLAPLAVRTDVIYKVLHSACDMLDRYNPNDHVVQFLKSNWEGFNLPIPAMEWENPTSE